MKAKNTHGGKRDGASRPQLPYKTKEIRRRITSHDYQIWGKEGESYNQFFERIETSVNEAIQKIITF